MQTEHPGMGVNLFTQGEVVAGPSPAAADRLQPTQAIPLALYSARRTSHNEVEAVGRPGPAPTGTVT